MLRKTGSLLCCLVVAVAGWGISSHAAASAPNDRDVSTRVRRAALAVYIHGMTEEIALREVGTEGVSELHSLLADPAFPRRDNVVAFLHYLSDRDTTTALLRFLDEPPTNAWTPEEERAFLLTPQALGRMARRGDRAALETLLEMTASGPAEGPLARALAARRGAPPDLQEATYDMSLRGLAFSGAAEARVRLDEIVRHPPGAIRMRDPAARARHAIDLFRELEGETAPSPSVTRPLDVGEAVDLLPVPPGEGDFSPWVLDTKTRVHDAGLSYANHVAVTNPMTDIRLDQVLDDAGLRAGRSDFSTDVACCITVSRSGAARTFGSSGDGLDVIDTDAELNSVLNNSVARVKVVRAINYCGSSGTNIIGCAWKPGNGMALVRMSTVGYESVLWIHEYGHNTGLSHATDNRYLMYGTDNGNNNALSQSECDTYHAPSGSSGMIVVDKGACTDNDADGVQDGVDNCPAVANANQADSNGNGIGDACESLDSDGDGSPDASDCAPSDPTAWAMPGEIQGLRVDKAPAIRVSWTSQGSGFRYDVSTGTLADLRSSGSVAGASCAANDLASSSWDDSRSGPSAGSGWYYITRSQNACGSGTYGKTSGGAQRLPGGSCN
jgi:hypothetical protein